MKAYQKIIFWLFAILLFFVPLILWPFTSEVFEFNKMVLVYILTTLITGTWLAEMIIEKKFVFRRTILDIPILAFIGSQIISTILSIDPLTSFLGYYSRFNGGLASVFCYALLYWAFVSVIDIKQTMKLIYITLGSATLVAIYGVLEHFGIDKNLWVQDVQSRVFSTLGQPNWLAAWLIALTPATWYLILTTNFNFRDYKFWLYFSLSILLFWTTIFTKSRSGYLGFATAFIIFWALAVWKKKKDEIGKLIIPFIIIGVSVFAVCLISGTELTPSIGQLISHKPATALTDTSTTALETGGTESGTIRKIVWKGAIQVWLHYPIFGTGIETFAFSYFKYRPPEHNLTSEWQFIYNKAHNEYLNFMANSGTVGILTYLSVIGFSIYVFVKNRKNLLIVSLFAGYLSLLVTNFFGFSVVPTQLELFLFPAMAFVIAKELPTSGNKSDNLNGIQKFFLLVIVFCGLSVLFAIGKYWYADTLYASGKAYNSVGKPDVATNYLTRAISLEPGQPWYYSELANSYASLAVGLNQAKDTADAQKYSDLAVTTSDKVAALAPANFIFKMSRFGVFVMLSTVNPNYLLQAQAALLDAINSAPTYASLYYNLGLTYARTNQTDLAIQALQKAIELKADYADARLAYAILLIGQKQNAEAKVQLNYILTKIDPNNSLAKQTLASIK
ncbi:MAG: O-antigen ligase family protein [Candidatus Microgenomates bacterium]